MKTTIRTFITEDGERTSVLVDGRGMPLFYANLYATWELRYRSLAANTILNTLNAIKVIYLWQDRAGIDLEYLFSHGGVLDENQIRDLSDFLQRKISSVDPDGKITRIRRKPNLVGSSNHYFRMSIAANYLGFLARRVRPCSLNDEDIKRMASKIEASRPYKPRKSNNGRDENYLDDAVVDFIAEALKPGSHNNPAKEHAVQVRNMLMFLILRVTGMRRGELLNLKTDDFDFRKGSLKVVRRPDSKGDSRTRQPVAKTLQRTIPIIPELINQIHDYILHHRNKIPGTKKHGYLFVTHKIGPYLGYPISISAFEKLMPQIASIVEGSGLHAHALRHHWNYTFSALIDSKGVSSEQDEKIRSYLMGWSETSESARIYNARHIKKKAAESVLEFQNNNLKKYNTEILDDK